MQELGKKLAALEKQLDRLSSWENNAGYGTAFPTNNLYTGRTFFRTDRGLEYYYDGTRWLSQPMPIELSWHPTVTSANYSVTTNVVFTAAASNALYDIYIDRVELSFQIASGGGTLNSSNHWTIDIYRQDSTATSQLITSYDTNNGGKVAGTQYQDYVNIASTFTKTQLQRFIVGVTKIGTIGNIFPDCPTVWVRMIG